MRVALLAAALLLIAAAIISSSWEGTPKPRIQRAIVNGKVTGDSMPDKPWAGASVQLGPERRVLAEDGTFQFAMMPGKYSLKICCSSRFQAIDRELILSSEDIDLNLPLTPLIRIDGIVNIDRGTEPPHGFEISVSLEGSNVVDRATTNNAGQFEFHLSEGKWTLSFDNLPKGYEVESITLGTEPVRDRTLELAEAAGSGSLPLRITLR